MLIALCLRLGSKFSRIVCYCGVALYTFLKSKEGYCALARRAAENDMVLYRIRPKVHLVGHIVFPGMPIYLAH